MCHFPGAVLNPSEPSSSSCCGGDHGQCAVALGGDAVAHNSLRECSGEPGRAKICCLCLVMVTSWGAPPDPPQFRRRVVGR